MFSDPFDMVLRSYRFLTAALADGGSPAAGAG
jgi:hypothetical protein